MFQKAGGKITHYKIMKKVKLFEQFISESKINVGKDLTPEIIELVSRLVKLDGVKPLDEMAVYMDMGGEIYNDRKVKKNTSDMIVVFYPELLHYREDGEDKIVPWIACRFEVHKESWAWMDSWDPENDDADVTTVWAAKVREYLEKAGYALFKDEDSFVDYRRKELRNHTEFVCFVNPSYPEGYWENHTLE